jgi:hypothetical protein
MALIHPCPTEAEVGTKLVLPPKRLIHASLLTPPIPRRRALRDLTAYLGQPAMAIPLPLPTAVGAAVGLPPIVKLSSANDDGRATLGTHSYPPQGQSPAIVPVLLPKPMGVDRMDLATLRTNALLNESQMRTYTSFVDSLVDKHLSVSADPDVSGWGVQAPEMKTHVISLVSISYFLLTSCLHVSIFSFARSLASLSRHILMTGWPRLYSVAR